MEAEMEMDEKKRLELYLHIPFCERKCLYCDFLSAPGSEFVRKSYVNQLVEEIRSQALVYPDYQVSTIFIGGGTPSVLKGQQIRNLVDAVYESFPVEAEAEMTIECNPGTLDEEKLEAYLECGINRISLGLQSSDNEELKLLGRIHTFEDFLHSYELVRKAGFHNVNVDLMSAIPYQTPEKWKHTLKDVLMLKPEHISAYSLIVEPGTPFHDLYSGEEGRKALPDEDADREMYRETGRLLKQYGYERYEISNYAKPGYECRHNIGYWTGEEYAGLGLGASSYVKGHRFHSERNLKNYLSVRMQEDLTPLFQDVEALTLEDQMEEFMFLGLRMTKGVSGADFMHRFGFNMFDVFAEAIHKHTVLGLLKIDLPYLRLTEKGLDLSNRVFADFYGTIHRGE